MVRERGRARAGIRSVDPASHSARLRHTAASLAISSGANVKPVQRMLGHASAAMTLDTYADLFEDDLDEVATRLNDQMPLVALPSGPQTRYARPQ
ncbi:tyrosine-type recombinase/integrase [uncultured Microbacterium sp.]|uniref:tyrosine-type recombinase/integrase n=1 Tax=uncultured Microbacterium sp. TaxID=191216 RepID=UPI0035CC414B